MSLLLNALNKSDNNLDEQLSDRQKKVVSLLSVLSGGRGGFLIGIIIGLMVVIFVGAVLFAYLYINKGSSEKNIYNNKAGTDINYQHVIKNKTSKHVEQIDDLDIELELGIPVKKTLGPDVEEDIAKEQTALFETAKRRMLSSYDKKGIPSRRLEIKPSDGKLPEFSVSGVVWDFERKYIFINGAPYSEKDKVMGVSIQHIGLSYFRVEYNNKVYDIVLH